MHDAGKADPEGNLAVRVLAMLQGFDFRNPNKSLPPEVDSLVRKTLKDAIDDVNELEKKYPFPKTSFGESAGSFAEVLDYYDTYKSRQNEIAKDGRKLMSPSKWLDFLYNKNEGDQATKNGLELQKRLASYLETHDPLKIKAAFTQTADVLKKVGSDAIGDIAKYFSHHGGKLVGTRSLAAASVAKKYLDPVSKATKRIPLASAAFVSVDYLMEPEEFSIFKTIEDVLMAVTLTSQTSACATVYCSDFIQECGTKLNVANKHSFSEITGHKEFSRCVFDFFQLPLDVQAHKRTDPDLNNLLLSFSPAVRSLTCEENGNQLKVTVDTLKRTKETESQVVQFNQSGNISIATLLPERQDQIRFEGRNASTLRHCKSTTDCKQFDMGFVKSEGTYFWKDENSAISGKLVNKIPVDSFRWAKANSSFLEIQSENIKNCCNDSKCRQKLSRKDFRSSASGTGYVSVRQ